MNKVIETGRLTREPEVRHMTGENARAFARYTLAVDRKYKRDGEQTADFIPCVAFGKDAEFADKYLHKGIKINIVGRLQSCSYINKDGQKVYTLNVIIEEQEFAESKKASEGGQTEGYSGKQDTGFMNIPNNIPNNSNDDEMPWEKI